MPRSTIILDHGGAGRSRLSHIARQECSPALVVWHTQLGGEGCATANADGNTSQRTQRQHSAFSWHFILSAQGFVPAYPLHAADMGSHEIACRCPRGGVRRDECGVCLSLQKEDERNAGLFFSVVFGRRVGRPSGSSPERAWIASDPRHMGQSRGVQNFRC